ncbi:transmembrane protein -like [Brachionus plicatilis]|uniref:Transmembrane protein-like n=1 Tax=Brachionus plicatilis TaxID=10195 RepID=A0A3M7R9P0_BRAPC|nr:transmembrane protein -like [Brachionus plicatilis]
MPGLSDLQPSQYGLSMGFIFIFNLIVGSGALTLPKAFGNSGIFLSLILLIFLNLMSFITATFMFEAMSIMNAIKNFRKFTESLGCSNPIYETETRNPKQGDNSGPVPINESLNETASEDRPLLAQTTPIQYNNRRILSNFFLGYAFDVQNDVIYKLDTSENFDSTAYLERSMLEDAENEQKEVDNLFAIRKKYEMAEMASVFFSKTGQFFFYIAMILYLYGDLAIYDAAVPKSLRDTTCTYRPDNNNQTLTEDDLCWSSLPSINRMNAYRLYVLLFNFTIGILVFYNVEKTKLLQLLTTIMRWAAFITMIALAAIKINDNSKKSIKPNVEYFNFTNVPNFFGVCIYAFMCHHSLPGIITPMRNKQSYKYVFIGVYLCVLSFYLLLSFTGVFAFGDNLDDFYTLNFLPDNQDRDGQGIFLVIIDYYLSLFPVFTISASFPIIGITLRNNLKSLYYFICKKNPHDSNNKNYFTSFGLPMITLIPPLLVSLITHDLQLLVGVTGSYAGVAIQYIIPSCLVYFGRKEAIRVFRKNYQFRHSFTSPFKSKFWVFFLLLWSNLCVIFVTVNHIINKK